MPHLTEGVVQMKYTIAVLLLLMGCGNPDPINGVVVIHLTNNGIVVNCETHGVTMLETGTAPSAICSQVEVKDERANGGSR